jgi:rhamnulose-1-phosphate aldolase/alcohol dehydrogenase
MTEREVRALPIDVPAGFPILAPEDRWSSEQADGRSGLELLAYRSNLLGSDRSVANWGGGNTSLKTREPDYRGADTSVLYVKGSGSDLATIGANQFTALRLDDVRLLEARESASDEEVVRYYDHAALRPGQPRASIETPLHSMVEAAHIDHTHPDAIIALCAIPDGRSLARRLWGRGAIWIDFERPGFGLGKKIARAIRERPEATCVLLAKHGLITWGDSSEACYRATIRTIDRAAEVIAEAADRRRIFAVPADPPVAPEIVSAALPALRGAVSARRSTILRLDSSETARAFASRPDIAKLSRLGPACPDHLVHTKPWPLVIDAAATGHAETLSEAFRAGVAGFEDRYLSYFARHAGQGQSPRDPAPRIVLVPNLGVIATGADAAGAAVSGQLYERAIAVLGATDALGGFDPLTEAESFGIETWPLELYKLTQKPDAGELAGRVAIVTGAASGIGRAIAGRLAAAGAHVVIADRNAEGSAAVASELTARFGPDRALAVPMDVTDEQAVVAGFARTTLAYGGVDILVSNAGIATSASIEDTTLEDWNRQQAVLVTGYFLVAREAFRIMRRQGRGGSVIFVASKNALVAGRNAAAYSSAKAAEIHLARCLAEEGGAAGIRVNTVNPDAVLRDSSIWDTGWREERARTYGIDPSDLDAFYRDRTTLRVSVDPEDVAEAVFFLASDRAAKSTGNILNVDGGVAAAYTR